MSIYGDEEDGRRSEVFPLVCVGLMRLDLLL